MSRSRELQIFENQVKEYNDKGMLFGFHYRDVIGSSATIEFAMKTPSNKIIKFLPAIIKCDKAITVDFYQDSTLGTPSNSLLTNIRCINQLIAKPTSITEVWGTPDITDYGISNYPDVIFANVFGAGETSLGIEWIAEQNVYYSSKIINTVAQAGTIKFSLYWLELEE